MSVRTYINGKQIFGNNDYFEEWDDFIESQGIKIDEDGCYEGYIHDFNGAMRAVEKIVKRKIEEQHKRVLNKELDLRDKPCTELFDLSFFQEEFNNCCPFQYQVAEMVENWYPFLTYQLFMACKDKLNHQERCCSYEITDPKGIEVRKG